MIQDATVSRPSQSWGVSVKPSIRIVFRALAHPTRRAVLELLRPEPMRAGRIALAFPVSRAAISKHIQELRRAGLVQEIRQGRNHFYRLNAQPLAQIELWLESYRPFGSLGSEMLAIQQKKARKHGEVEVPAAD
jgi:DNA-binding transcriptional ArsR family regulator